MHNLVVILVICALLISVCPCTGTASPEITIHLDGNDQGRVFDGIGVLSAGAASRLLIDYPEPQRSQILDFLFKPNFGASLHDLKVEIGGTMNSTWGSEPSHANTLNEFEHPKPEYYDRGYEWWLMKEARKRNPGIILESLPWGVPGWIGQLYTQIQADYVVQFIKGARDYHGITINYQGILNEDSNYKPEWIKLLRKDLDDAGLQAVKIVASDVAGVSAAWKIVQDVNADPELSKSVHAITIHYPVWCTADYLHQLSPDAAKNLGKPLWCGEDAVYGDPWARADGFAKLYNRNYILGRMTKTLINVPITSNFEFLSPFNVPIFNNPGLMKANTPWSGHYEVPPSLWATAHTTQFTKPGWRYLDGGCGLLGQAGETGSYVTLRSPDESGNYSIIIETMKGDTHDIIVGTKDSDPLPDIPTRQVMFNVKNLSEGTVHVWRSNKADQFVQLPDITPESGTFTVTLEGNSIYTLTTTTGQHKGSCDIPKNSPFPFPYKDNFEGYALGKMAKYLSDEQGTFAIATRMDAHGKCLRQIVPQAGIGGCGREYPWTIVGNAAWNDYETSVDVHLGEKGFAGIYGRIDDPLTKYMPGGYGLFIDNTGAWQLKDTTTLIESGKVKLLPDAWHNLKLKFIGSHVIAVIDGNVMCSIMDDFHLNGVVALASSYDCIEFDNLSIKPYKGHAPKPTVQWENLALGKKVIASKELNADHSAAKVVDGSHTSGWCPGESKSSDEWLEIDFGKETTFDRTIIDQHKLGQSAGGITSYKIQYWNGSNWKDAFNGSSMAMRQMDDFPQVTANKVRLLITECSENSGVYEFQVYQHKT